MKKFMTTVLAAALVFAAAGQASAAALETKGEFRARYWFLQDYFQTIAPQSDDTVDFTDQRLRLYMTWPVSEGVKVQARADILEQFWGANNDFNDATFFTANNQIDFDWVNAIVAVPGTPVTLTVGKQDVSWGPGILAKADNRYRAKMAAKLGMVGLSLSYDKNIETLGGATLSNGLNNQTDSDGVTLGVTGEAAGFKFGVLGAFANDDTTPHIEKHRYGIDGFVTGQAGPVMLNAEVAYYTGENHAHGSTVVDQDVSGMLAYAGASMPAGPVTIGLEFAYAQGDDPTTAENEGVLKFDYQSPFWSVILFNNFDLPGWESSPGAADVSVSNAMAGKLSATAKLMPKLSLYGAVVYADRLEDVRNASGAIVKADELGIEFDVIAMYSLAENVAFNVGFGYLAAGDFYGDVEDPWGATAHLVVTF